MAEAPPKKAPRTDCQDCWLRRVHSFREFSATELAFVSTFKTGQLAVDAGSTILVEGSHSAHLYTVLEGWGFRYKILPDGRRQILNYILPGDLIGLQGTLMGEMQHSVEALSAMQLCVFERERIASLYENHASLAFDVTWIAAQEERILDEHLLSIGRRTASERAAYLLAFLCHRAQEAGLRNGSVSTLPVTQQHVADTLGLSIVHTNKTLRKLADRGVIRWLERGCEVLDKDGLCKIADWQPDQVRNRPFI
jgi:CRP/FNR family transcriptional regulator